MVEKTYKITVNIETEGDHQIELTAESAKDLYKQLKSMFEGNEVTYVPYPVYYQPYQPPIIY